MNISLIKENLDAKNISKWNNDLNIPIFYRLFRQDNCNVKSLLVTKKSYNDLLLFLKHQSTLWNSTVDITFLDSLHTKCMNMIENNFAFKWIFRVVTEWSLSGQHWWITFDRGLWNISMIWGIQRIQMNLLHLIRQLCHFCD